MYMIKLEQVNQSWYNCLNDRVEFV